MDKIYLFFLITILTVGSVSAQDSDADESVSGEVSLDMLQSPTSPAANMIGISDGQIERPTDPADFMIMLNQASSNFSGLPTSFAVDVAPAWLFYGQQIDMDQYLDSTVAKSIAQSFVLSLATRTVDSLGEESSDVASLTQVSMGFKFSLLRGKVGSETIQSLARLREARGTLLSGFSARLDQAEEGDAQFQALKKQADSIRTANIPIAQKRELLAPIQEKIEKATEVLMDKVKEEMAEEFEMLKKTAEKVSFKRYGFKVDIAAGWVFDFPKQNFDKLDLSRAGAWLTLGNEWKSGASLFGMARYLYSPEAILADDSGNIDTEDVQTFDAGLRFNYEVERSKFSFGGEGLYRSALNVEEIDPSWRFTLNAAYDLGKNKKLTLVFGRDFDGLVTKDGNLIAALNLLIGLGGNRSL